MGVGVNEQSNLLEVNKRPLITFFVVAYNQEQFIREAIAGAFSQTYQPLEIILSDDCSVDQTFEIMQEMARDYRGSHTVVLNRNEHNRGIGGHVSRVMELSHGDLIIASAGDDVSLPERTSVLYRAWENSDRKALSLFSAYTKIDEAGKQVGTCSSGDTESEHDYLSLFNTTGNVVHGCVHAWDRRVFEVFGPLKPEIVTEDVIISLRSSYLGMIRYTPETLVRYRLSRGGICRSRYLDRINFHTDYINVYEHILGDVLKPRSASLISRHHNKFVRYAKYRCAFHHKYILLLRGELRGIDTFRLPMYAILSGASARRTLSFAFRALLPRLHEYISRAFLKGTSH
jgi:glycosyltransferase involved in cell wall biosynthesis